ncbi:MAG: NAD(P)-dependent oxidoreductase [Pelagibacteraceae bacterium]|jgi:3-hydroxyisobutyrate dehydrogenase|nr:NAD(P)-dependent oxidoreductase [Pelagibacteraceae bacterium]HJL58251.1 NAD(P)-dependent oxidoreductase [Alphaproteobacteria bacterium]MBO6466299.1 NAD(P)-dependent oxidoreductase [Pelagibacteraceae bacterium]MBO6468107.1 NAD(P)-dependent oxidoreductase [Pelagibacteraceae bacterium]MBO6469549.1 NAD(P)-dependent oxidoreductase [Pelagibacteraceae bacterium]|tara:strand:- start:1114 stop:1986 length:873 start_codon:yes stop_codon:yes gene_type:complete
MTAKKVTFIGLGVMGYPMAGHLINNNFEVTVFNRTRAKSDSWVKKYQGLAQPTPGMASQNSEIVFICVGRDDDLRDVMEGDDGIINNVKENSIIVDHTTSSANIAKEYFNICKSRKLHFLDAPISGGQAGAENGQLSIMIGGEKTPFEEVKPVLASYGKAIELIGPSGSGQLTKMINQICIAGLVQGLSEAMAFGKKSNLDMEKVLKVISKGAAQSWQMENRYKTMLEGKFNFGFAVDWMRKDLSICFDESKKNGSKLPITEIIDKYYAEIQSTGGNRFDTSSLMTLVDI